MSRSSLETAEETNKKKRLAKQQRERMEFLNTAANTPRRGVGSDIRVSHPRNFGGELQAEGTGDERVPSWELHSQE